MAGDYQVITIAGTGEKGYSGDGGPAVEALLNNPFGLVRGPDGALYFCDTGNHTVRKIDTGGILSTIAGAGSAGYAGDGGPARAALLNEPYEIRFDADGNLYIVERLNHVVRRIDSSTSIITTLAGNGTAGFVGDGSDARDAQLKQPHSIQFGADHNLYICDIGNHRIRRIDRTSGLITTFAGTGRPGITPDGSPLPDTDLNGPRALDRDSEGNLWLALREGNAVYMIDWLQLRLYHKAGTGQPGFDGHGGPATKAKLSGPKGIAVGPDGNIYLADTESHSVRRINRERGTLELIAGTGIRGDGPDGDASTCRFARPHGVFVDRDGAIYVGDSENHRIRKIVPVP